MKSTFYMVAFGLCFAANAYADSPKPNVIFFLVDDMGFMDIACNGSNVYETPNIDALAKSGVRFTQAYAACGVCSPSRHAILTGKYPARSGCTNYGMPMKAAEFTLAEAMKDLGYENWFVGKWHLGKGKGQMPKDQGFDVNIGGGKEGQPGSYFWPYARQGSRQAGTLTRHLKAGGQEGEYLTDRLGNEAVKLIEQHTGENPFFLYFSFYSVHTPIMAKRDDVEYFKEKIARIDYPDGPKMSREGNVNMKQVQDSPEFAAMVKSVDDAVGNVLAQLEEKGIVENTLIFFTSDNGGAAYYKNATSNLPLRGAKGWYYEGGIREPFIVAWPNTISPGVSQEKVIGTDVYPTIMDLVGGEQKQDQHVDGISIKDALFNQQPLPERNLYWYYPHDHGSGSKATSAMISGDYKIIQSLRSGRVQVYNLNTDIGEKEDLSKSDQNLTSRLLEQLKTWQSGLNLQEQIK